MAPIFRRRATTAMLDPFAQLDSYGEKSGGGNRADNMKNNNNVRNNNANVQQYPVPSSSLPINRAPDAPIASQSSTRVPASPENPQGVQTPVQVPQPSVSQSTSNVMSTPALSTTSLSSTPSSVSLALPHSTSAGSTLTVPPPRSVLRSESTALPSLTFLSQTFSNIDSSSPSTSDDTGPTSPLKLSSTVVTLLISIGGLILLTTFICILRCALRQCRHNRRRRKQSAFDFARAAEKRAWDEEKSGGLGVAGSPSTIFGGQERSGLTPQPSWMTFHEGTESPYPLGLLPLPASHPPGAPPTRAHGSISTGLGISHPGFPSRPDRTRNMSQPYPPLHRPFEPPTITITDSSPRQSGHGLRSGWNGNPAPPPMPSLNDGMSPANSYNRVSVYADPVNGAQLVQPPWLMLANDDPSLSESDAGLRQSGWSSWDDSVGVELGIKIDRKHLPTRRKSRIPVSKAKGAASPLRITLAPVTEVSSSSSRDLPKPSSKSPTSPNSRLHPHNPNARLRRGPSSPTSPLRRSPRSMKSTSPRAGKGMAKQAASQQQRLYDLPQFEATSPNSMCVASPASPLPSLSAATSATNSPLGDGSLKRKSKGAPCRTGTGTPTKVNRPPSNVSETLSDAYAYVHEYARGLSSTESEEIQVRRRPKRSSATARSPKSENGPSKGVNRGEAAHYSPAVRDTIGVLMMKAYDEEGAIASPSMPWLGEKGKGRKPLAESGINIPTPSLSRGLGLNIQGQPRLQPRRRGNASATGPSSPLSMYSECPTHEQQQQQRQRQQPYPGRAVPSLPPPGMPNLHQLKLMREMPDYRSPTYSVYGMYRDENGTSPLVTSPTPVQYRYASPGNGRVVRASRRADVI